MSNEPREGEEKKREGGRKCLNFDVKMIGLSCLLVQKNREFLNFQTKCSSSEVEELVWWFSVGIEIFFICNLVS